MSVTYESVEQAARQLTTRERAALAQTLLRELDGGEDEDVEAFWIEEAKRRYEAYLRGEMSSSPGGDVFARVRERLQRERA